MDTHTYIIEVTKYIESCRRALMDTKIKMRELHSQGNPNEWLIPMVLDGIDAGQTTPEIVDNILVRCGRKVKSSQKYLIN